MKKRVLFADDNHELFALLSFELGKDYTFFKAGNELGVYTALYANNPHIILLDTYMPPSSGFAILANIRKRSNVPIIMLSSLCTKKHVLKAWKGGANFLLEKPFDLAELRENIEALVNGFECEDSNNFRARFSFMVLSKKYSPEITRVIRYVEENFNKDTTLKSLSDVANMTPSYLSRTFKKHTGYSVNDFVSRYKVHVANELFLNGLNVKEVAFYVGYEDEKYFSKVYKKISGVSPKSQKLSTRNMALPDKSTPIFQEL